MIAFDSYHFAIRAEQLLSVRMAVRVMPTLRCVSESCGMSLRLPVADGGAAAEALRVSDLPAGSWRRYLVFDGGSRALLCEDGKPGNRGPGRETERVEAGAGRKNGPVEAEKEA